MRKTIMVFIVHACLYFIACFTFAQTPTEGVKPAPDKNISAALLAAEAAAPAPLGDFINQIISNPAQALAQMTKASATCLPAAKNEVFTFSGYGDKKQIEDMLSNTYNINVASGIRGDDGGELMRSGASFRLHRNWLLTAAHGLDVLGDGKTVGNMPVNIKVVFKRGMQKVPGENDYAIMLSKVSASRPANGYVYVFNGIFPGQGPERVTNWFHRNGSVQTGLWWTYTPQTPNIDVALIRIDEGGPISSIIDTETVFDAQSTARFNKQAKAQIKETQKQAAAVLNKQASNDMACFLSAPIKDYEILIIDDPENSMELAARPVLAFFFKDGKMFRIFKNSYQAYSNDYMGVRFSGEGIVPGTSGSAIVQGKRVVGLVTTAKPQAGLVASPYYNEKIRAFIKDTMGADASGVKFVKPIIAPIPMP
ncbi:MAG: hypothetical protein LBR90_00740 [Elusimicrobiota bacterium]|jgi:hypothetical protein|nr:hypothetical protein [Elusimicrobiota bacterium]